MDKRLIKMDKSNENTQISGRLMKLGKYELHKSHVICYGKLGDLENFLRGFQVGQIRLRTMFASKFVGNDDFLET